MKLKICGITRIEDALFAEGAGADYLGVVLVPSSSRCVTPEQASEIFRAVRRAKKVCVTADMPLAELRQLVLFLRPDVLQLHGKESPDDLRELDFPEVWKAFDLRSRAALEEAESFPCSAVLADAGRGGSGHPCVWKYAAQLAKTRRTVLAGGLTAENIQEAVLRVSPWAVDVSGGVESAPGVKNHQKIMDFSRRIGK